MGGPRGGGNSQQAHDVVTTSMRRNDVASTSFRRHVPTRFLINQCQIITFLILKYDIIENSRIELRGIVLPVQVCGLLGGGGGGGGGQRVCWPPLPNYWGGLAPPPPPWPPLFLRLWCSMLYCSDSVHFQGKQLSNFQFVPSFRWDSTLKQKDLLYLKHVI